MGLPPDCIIRAELIAFLRLAIRAKFCKNNGLSRSRREFPDLKDKCLC